MNDRVTLKEAINFHGHLGPYLILGILAGELALKKLRCKKYFGLKVMVWGANKKPKSCLIDGLQLSTGATYGKGNIIKLPGPLIKIEFTKRETGKKITVRFKNTLMRNLEEAKTHRDSELLAKKIYGLNPVALFNLEGVI
jgi:formylmethanofuran dehydrogenase subunit E